MIDFGRASERERGKRNVCVSRMMSAAIEFARLLSFPLLRLVSLEPRYLPLSNHFVTFAVVLNVPYVLFSACNANRMCSDNDNNIQ